MSSVEENEVSFEEFIKLNFPETYKVMLEDWKKEHGKELQIDPWYWGRLGLYWGMPKKWWLKCMK